MTTIRRAQESQAPLLPVAPLASRSVATRPTVTTTQVPGQGDSFVRSQQAPVNLAGTQAPQQAIPVTNHVILSSPNQERAGLTSASLAAMARQSPQAGQRLTPDIRGALELGVANPRTNAANGQEGVLGQRQAEQAARALVAMPQAQYDQLKSLLNQAGKGPNGQPAPGADAAAERALILKAVAARSSALSSSGPAAAQAMQELQGFASEVRGMNRPELIRTTSVLDLDETTNTSTVDPNNQLSTNDQRANNDGLFQRFQHSCAPTSGQILRAEADPVYARALHRGGLDNLSVNAPIAQEQAQVLEKKRFVNRGGVEVQLTPEQRSAYQGTGALPPGISVTSGSAETRLGSAARAQINTSVNEAERTKKITSGQATAIREYMKGSALSAQQQSDMNAGLTVLRGSSGFPTQAQLDAVRSDATRPPGDDMLYHHALADVTTPATNIQYKLNPVGRNGMTPANLQQLETLLKSGQDVPVSVISNGAGGGHAMVFTDVRGSGNNRSFLLSDPWSGRTDWVSEQDLSNANSGFLRRQFDLSWTHVFSIYDAAR